MKIAKRKTITKEEQKQRFKSRIRFHKEEIKRYKKLLKSIDTP